MSGSVSGATALAMSMPAILPGRGNRGNDRVLPQGIPEVVACRYPVGTCHTTERVMTYPDPQQPGNWNDPAWPPQQPGYQDPSQAPAAEVPQGGYAAPAYPGYGYPPVYARPTNGMAIAALVCSLAGIATCISAPIGAILGHIARKQIRERGEGGDGMALAGIIVGWIITGLMLLLIAFYVVMIIFAINNGAFDDPSTY